MPELAASQLDDAAQERIRSAFVAAFADADRGTSGWRCWRGRTRAWRPCSRSPRWLPSPQFVARGVVSEASHPTEGALAQLAPLLAGMERPAGGWGAVALPDMTQTDTEHLLKEAGVDGETVARWVARQVVA